MPSHVFHRSTRSEWPVAVGGRGIELIAADGRRFIDASGGAAVSCLGHGHPAVTRAISQQAQALAYAHTSFFTNEPAEALADCLVAQAPAGLSRVCFVDNGSAAVETALKMARQYHIETGATGRTRVISRKQSYHGNTLGALAVGGNVGRRAPYEPFLFEAALIEPCFEYRYAREGETAEEYGRRAADALEKELLWVGPDSVTAFIAETVVGATAGAVPPAPGYLRRIREICDRYGVLLIGHTYSAHAIACAAALAVQRVIRDEGLLDRVTVRGQYLRDRLEECLGQHRCIGDIRGRDLLMALELVAERNAKTPFDPALKMHSRLKAAALERGLLVYPGGGTIDGRRGDHVLLAPPYNVTEAELDVIIDRLTLAVDSTVAA